VWLGHFVEHLVCNQRKKILAPTPPQHNAEIFEAKWQSAGWWAYIDRATVPVGGNNRDQCPAVRHVLAAGALVPVVATNRDHCPA